MRNPGSCLWDSWPAFLGVGILQDPNASSHPHLGRWEMVCPTVQLKHPVFVLVSIFPTQEQMEEAVLADSISSDWKEVCLSPVKVSDHLLSKHSLYLFQSNSLCTNSTVYSLALPQTCAFLATFSPTAGSERRGFTSAKWRIMTGAGRELQGTSCAYFLTEGTLAFSSSLWEAEFCLDCTMSSLRAKS